MELTETFCIYRYDVTWDMKALCMYNEGVTVDMEAGNLVINHGLTMNSDRDPVTYRFVDDVNCNMVEGIVNV